MLVMREGETRALRRPGNDEQTRTAMQRVSPSRGSKNLCLENQSASRELKILRLTGRVVFISQLGAEGRAKIAWGFSR